MDLNLIILMAIVVIAYGIGAMVGFGAMLIAVLLAAHYYPVSFLVPVLVPINLLTSGYLLLRHRKQVRSDLLWRRIVPWSVAGMPAGLWLFHALQGQRLDLVLGVFVFVYSSWELTRRFVLKNGRPVPPLSNFAGRVCLLAGGVMQGMYSTGGPLFVIYTSRAISGKTAFRSTMVALFVLVNALLFAGHLLTGTVDRRTLFTTMSLLPALAVGIAVGEFLHPKISEQRFTAIVYLLLVLAGGSLLFR